MHSMAALQSALSFNFPLRLYEAPHLQVFLVKVHSLYLLSASPARTIHMTYVYRPLSLTLLMDPCQSWQRGESPLDAALDKECLGKQLVSHLPTH